jgi:hypothetical protein
MTSYTSNGFQSVSAFNKNTRKEFAIEVRRDWMKRELIGLERMTDEDVVALKHDEYLMSDLTTRIHRRLSRNGQDDSDYGLGVISDYRLYDMTIKQITAYCCAHDIGIQNYRRLLNGRTNLRAFVRRIRDRVISDMSVIKFVNPIVDVPRPNPNPSSGASNPSVPISPTIKRFGASNPSISVQNPTEPIGPFSSPQMQCVFKGTGLFSFGFGTVSSPVIID